MIYKVEPNSPTSTKITEVNDMVMEVNGKVAGAAFDKIELDQVFLDTGFNRMFIRNASIGNTIATYNDWTHVLAESGYSIWKYNITDYAYNLNNQLFIDNKLIDFRGQASAETATTFYKAYFYDGLYTDETVEAGTEGGTAFATMSSTDDFLYLGQTAEFAGAKFEFATKGTNYTLKLEYYNGAWVELTANTDNLVDNTSNFASDGSIVWDAPDDWTTDVVNGESAYWIRISTTSTPTTVATVNYVIPNNSVVGLLALSSSQIQNELWAWCSYGTSVYITIRNIGNSAYEGNYFLTSSSSDTNKRNYFIYNHALTANYQDTNYDATVLTLSSVSVGDLVYVSENYTFSQAIADDASKKAVGVATGLTSISFAPGLLQDVNTVGAADIVAGNILYLSETAGKVTKTAPTGGSTYQQKVGVAIAAETSSKVHMIMNIEWV